MRTGSVLFLLFLAAAPIARGQDVAPATASTGSLDGLLKGLEERRRPEGWGSGSGAALSPEEVEARRAVAAATKDVLAVRDSANQAGLRDRYRTLAAARDRLHRISLQTIGAATSAGGGIRVADLRGALRANEALVLYGRDEDRAVALVVEPSGARRVDLGDRMDIEDAIAGILERLDTDAPDVKALADDVRKVAVAPLALPAATKTVLLGLDGPVASVPPSLLFPDQVVALLPCTSVVLQPRRDRSAQGKEVLAVGDPEFRPVLGPPAPLPGAAKEAKEAGAVALLGSAATREALKSHLGAATPWRSLHLAGRVEMDPERPLLTAFGLAASGDDDGRWTAREIALEKIQADLVVLSACLSCGTSCVPDAGVAALPCAFLAAGVPSVVGFVGVLDDAAGAAFSSALYRALRSGAPVGEAVRRAQAEVRADPRFSAPRFWLGWTLWGLPD